MSQKTSKRRWRDRAEEMLAIAQTMPNPEARAEMQRLAADWLMMAADDKGHGQHDLRSANERNGKAAASAQIGAGADPSSSKSRVTPPKTRRPSSSLGTRK
jgi:hypothetical protein